MRKTFLILLGAASGAALTLAATQPRLMQHALAQLSSTAKAAPADTYRQLNLFGDVFERVRADYVEKPDDTKLIESAINGMLAGLDPHSSYLSKDELEDFQIQMRLSLEGIGASLSSEDAQRGAMRVFDQRSKVARASASKRWTSKVASSKR